MHSFHLKTKGCLSVLLFLASAGTVASSDRLSYCQILETDIQDSEASLNVSRNYQGLWFSEKCETRSGPLFLLRQYRFHRNGRFHLVQYRYNDPFCSSPSYGVVASGTLVPSPEKATSSHLSWVVQGGLELDYILHKVTVIPFTVADGDKLYRLVNRSCPGYSTSKWRSYRKYRVLSYSEDSYRARKKPHHLDIEDMDCTRHLDLGFNELQLTRLERRLPVSFTDYRHRHQMPPEMKKRFQSFLFLGIDNSKSQRRPTYYQSPLVLSESAWCSACRSLAKASPTSPPKLFPPPSGPTNLLKGDWVSARCEVRPSGMFVKRRYSFDSFQGRWSGQLSYFKHPICKALMFHLSARGTFLSVRASASIPSAWEYDFEVQQASLTPQDPHFAANLNALGGGASCGGSAQPWILNKTRDLTPSGGCRALGISVPATEPDVLKFEQDKSGMLLLYLGETSASEAGQRPTSFQPPLVQCASGLAVGLGDRGVDNRLNPMPLVSSAGNSKAEICAALVVYCAGILWFFQ